MWLLVGALAGLVGLLGLRPVARWMAVGGHRYADETDHPVRSVRWMVPVGALAAALVGAARSATPWYAAVLVAGTLWLVVLVAIDVDVHRLPDRLTKPAWLVVPAVLAVVALARLDWSWWWRPVLIGLGVGVGYLLLFFIGLLVGGSALGAGDVKLSVPLGMLVGVLGVGAAVLSVLATFLLGGLWAAFLLVSGRARRDSHMAFGPFMALGAWLVWVAPAVAALVA